MRVELQDIVARELERAGLVDAGDRVPALVAFLELLARWGGRINLTSRAEPSHVAQRLLPDAFALAAHLAAEVHRVLDVGSGAGVPGLVLALLRPDLEVQLVEAHRRKCAFLRTAAADLGLRVTVLEGRIEELSPPACDLACSKATFAPSAWLALGATLVRPGGAVAAFLVPHADPPSVPPTLGEESRWPYTLHDGTPRLLLLLRRRFT